MIRDTVTELLFGDAEVLVCARDLVNDQSVRAREGGQVTYVHLIFDRHQVVFSEGLPTESFPPGPQTTDVFEAEIVAEICGIIEQAHQIRLFYNLKWRAMKGHVKHCRI